jgi:serine/threonine-protein kinase
VYAKRELICWLGMSAAAKVKAGDVLGGKYRVERVLGTGGMGMVVSARHVQLGQRVALKFMLKEAMADPGNAERFAREARAAVRLQSPHTARVSDVGKLKNGEPYMVMEYLEGQDLDEVLRRNGPMPPHVAVAYILQACEAFAEAHGMGMIHRDIKPKNLFLAKTVSGNPIVKVLDFGLAKTIGGTGDVSLTATSAVFGSPQYMSPEQMRSAKDVDARSDIWSIGVCLYELLTTRVPFDAGGLAEICAMVLKDPVVPPSHWAQGLPLDLDTVVVKCLEKDPAKRYQTVAELAFALEPWSADEGSARRIMHVMQTVQKTDVPTIMNIDPAMQAEAHDAPKTMDAWDSGERTRVASTTPRFSRIQMAYAGLGALALVGVVFTGVAVVHNVFTGVAVVHNAKAGSNAAATSASAPSAADPPFEPVPVAAVATTAAPATSTPAAPATTVAVAPPSPPPPVMPDPPVVVEPPPIAGTATATVAVAPTKPTTPKTVATAPAKLPVRPPAPASSKAVKDRF